ncbi:hypothetical protein [Pseudomonas sp. ICMP 561]|uniref:hypothetical protein n=1 Tax=Pseudomonas sp. ICMP 561 TaxID=1718918 RepID=UPI0011456C9C|nr:hypothetical protein [Pseudomonas sp. ICMP 561]
MCDDGQRYESGDARGGEQIFSVPLETGASGKSNGAEEMSASNFEASDEVVNEAAASCARLLEKWFGGVEEAFAALEAEPAGLADLAMRSHINQRKAMTVCAHINIHAFSREVLQQVS